LGAQIGKMFSNYIAMAGFLHFLGTQIKKKMISNYTFMVWYLHFLDALIEKKRTQHGLKHQLEILRSHYRDCTRIILFGLEMGSMTTNPIKSIQL